LREQVKLFVRCCVQQFSGLVASELCRGKPEKNSGSYPRKNLLS
jgi:hypothetical protein